MKNSNNFWKKLQIKLEHQPTSSANQRFWEKFDSEFSEQKPWYSKLRLPVWLPVAASLVVVSSLWWKDHSMEPQPHDIVRAHETLEQEELLRDLDIYADSDVIDAVVGNDEESEGQDVI